MAACCLWVAAFPALADEVSFSGDGHLSGRVLMLNENGTLELESALAREPLVLKGDHVARVKFHSPIPGDLPGDTRLDLVNGDFLTGALLGYTPDTGARVSVDGIGAFDLPRGSLRSLTPGLRNAEVIYRGPDEEANWTGFALQFDTAWMFSGDALSVKGPGRIARMFELPDHYVIRFNLAWHGQPNFMFSFADPLKDSSERVDRYYLQFGAAGLEIKRESATGRRYTTLGLLVRMPEDFPDQSMDIEIRVCRREAMIHLAINGQPAGRFLDPLDNPPSAGGIAFVSNAQHGTRQEIRNLIIQRHDDPPRPPDAADPMLDTMVMRNGETHNGTLLSIRDTDNGQVFSFKSGIREEPLDIPAADIAGVIMATGDTADGAAAPEARILLELHDRGRLAATSSAFNDRDVRATHPLLGEILLSRDGISTLKHRAPEAENLRETRPEHAGELQFLNGNQIPGRMVALDRDWIVWDAPMLEGHAAFFTREMRGVTPGTPRRLPDPDAQQETTLTLANGDVVIGRLVSVSEDEIALDTWPAGRLTFRRPMVHKLAMRDTSGIIFRGPGPLADWTQPDTKPAWTAGDGNTMVAERRGTIARKIPFPDEFALEFDVEWQGSLQLQLILLSDDPQADQPGQGYEITFQRQVVSVRNRAKREWIGRSDGAAELLLAQSARIRIQASLRTGTIACYINDRLIDVWTDPDADPEKSGPAIHLISLDRMPKTISRMKVSAWDGLPDGEMPEEEGILIMRDGARFDGRILSIQDGIIRIDNEWRDTPLPIKTARTLVLGNARPEEPKRENGDIRVWFADGASMVFRLDGVGKDGKTAMGYGQAFGDAEFDISTFKTLEFNIYGLFDATR